MTNSSKRLAPVSIRFSADERATLDARAGTKPLSTYIKTVLFANNPVSNRNAPISIKGDREELAKLLAWLGQTQISVHLAVIAHAADTGTLPLGELTTSALLKACSDIDAMRESLMRAIGKIDTADSIEQNNDVIILPAFLSAVRPSEDSQ